MSPALSSPSPAARMSRANSTPPRPTNRCAVMRSWNSSRTPSTSSGSTEPRRISSRVIDSTSRGRSWARMTPASSLDIWARKTAALRTPGISGRDGAGAAAGPAGRSPTSCSTLAMLTVPSRLRLGQPAAQHRGDLVRPLAHHRRDLPAHPLALGGLRLELRGVADDHLTRGGDPQPLQLGEHLVVERQRLVLLLDLLAPARAQPHDEDDEDDARRDGAGADHRPELLLLLRLTGGLHVGGGGVGGAGVERHGRDGDGVPAGR